MTSPIPPPSQASSPSPLSAATPLPIAQLDPLLPSLSSNSIKAIVTLIWPYSSSKRSISLLLAEPDFRLRHSHGQVRVHFHGSAAKAIVGHGIGSGDVVSLGLEGADWLRAEAATTPGKGIDWELSFAERLLMELSRGAQENVVLDIDHPTPSPEPEVQAASPSRSPSPQALSISSQRLPEPPKQAPLNEWSSPAFLKRARLSSGSLFGSSYDPFVDADGFIEGKGRKRTRFWRESGQWRYTDRTPSPEKEIAGATSPEGAEDVMDTNEDVAGTAFGLDARDPLAEEQESEGSVLGNYGGVVSAEALEVIPENKPKSTEPNAQNFDQTNVGGSGRHQEGPQVQELCSITLNVAHGGMATVLSSLELGEATVPPLRADHADLPEPSGGDTVPHTQHSSIVTLQPEAFNPDEYRASFGSQVAPLSPRLRPVPSPSLPAVSPFDSSFTETFDYLDPVQVRVQPDSEAAVDHDKANRDERPELEIESLGGGRDPPTLHHASRYSDSNADEQLELDAGELEVAEAHPATLTHAARSTVVIQSRDLGDEQGDMDKESESETDEFGDDEREELYSSIIPRLKQVITTDVVDERDLQSETYEDIQYGPRSSSPSEADRNGEAGLGGKSLPGSDDSDDSDDQQSLSQGAQISDEEHDSDEEQYEDEFAEGYGVDSERGESEEDEEEYSSSPSPVPQKRAATRVVEVIDLISDDDDEPQQAAQSGVVSGRSMRFGSDSDGAAMSSFHSEPKADDFAEQWDRVLASQNESRSRERDPVEEAEDYEQILVIGEENEVQEGGIKADQDEMPEAQVIPESVPSQGPEGAFEIEQRDTNGKESLRRWQTGKSIKETQSQMLDTRQPEADQMEVLEESGSEIEEFGETGEVKPAREPAVGVHLTAGSRSDMGGSEGLNTGDNEKSNNVGPRGDTVLDERELSPGHEAEEYGTLGGNDGPQRFQHTLSSTTDLDLVDTQQEPTSEGDSIAGNETQHPIWPAVEDDQNSPPPPFITEPLTQIPKTAFKQKPNLQLSTPEATQQTFVSSQLSVLSAPYDIHPTPAATQEDPLSPLVSLPSVPQEEIYPTLIASQEILTSPLPQLPQEQIPVSSPAQGVQATPPTPQGTHIIPSEPPVTPSSSQESLLQKLREIKSASGKRQRMARDAVPDVISPWFTTKEVDQSEINTEGGGLHGHEIRVDAHHESIEVTQRSSNSARASPSPLNGLTISPLLTSPTVDAAGITTTLSYFSLLSTLQLLFSNIVDVLAIVTRHQPIERARHGSRDYMLSLAISDPSISTSITVTISRPFKLALPVTSNGDGILLRGFKVTSQKRKLLLQSTDASSWAVFKSNGEVQIRGPPVEYGEGEAQEVESLKQWWRGLGPQAWKEVAARALDEQHDTLVGASSGAAESH